MIFTKRTQSKNVQVFIHKNYFNSRIQKKIITSAARKSAEQQRELVNRYNELVLRAK